jgi:hypothetical protein
VKLDLAAGPNPTYADLVFLSVFKLVQSGPRLLRPIYKSIIACLANIAPYTKRLSKEASDGLIWLLIFCTKKDFLLEKEDNCRATAALFECLNYLVAYHDESTLLLQVLLMKNQACLEWLESEDLANNFP